MFGVVAAKEARINNDATNNTGQPETNDAPIVTWRASSPALPPVHPLPAVGVLALDEHRRTRPQQILLGRKEIIIREEHRPPDALGCEIDQLSKVHFSHKKAQKELSHKEHKVFEVSTDIKTTST